MINVTGLTKLIDGNIILDNIDMNVPTGSIYGLVGTNGAGKSTIIRCLVGTYRFDKGQVLIDNQQVTENPSLKSQIAYIPDDIFFHTGDTINSLMKFYRGLYGEFDMERYEKLISIFPMINKKKLVRSYSKGMQRQLAFILSLCIHPKVMILDEPLDGLDPVMRKQILGLILKDVTDSQTTVLISSHNLRELEDICDHVGIMNNGKIIIERSLSELQSSILKVQIAFNTHTMPKLPENLNILHKISVGKVHTIILKGENEGIEHQLKALNPILMDVLPLTLEEIFIYEMGGVNYGTKSIYESIF